MTLVTASLIAAAFLEGVECIVLVDGEGEASFPFLWFYRFPDFQNSASSFMNSKVY